MEDQGLREHSRQRGCQTDLMEGLAHLSSGAQIAHKGQFACLGRNHQGLAHCSVRSLALAALGECGFASNARVDASGGVAGGCMELNLRWGLC